MIKIALAPNASGSGTVPITAPNTNTNRTIALPDVAGNVVTTGDTGTVTSGMVAGVNASALPAGTVIQTLQTKFNPSGESTTSATYQSSAMHMTIEKHFATSKVLVIMAQAHQYVNQYPNGTLSTICQEGSSSTLTASTT